MNFLEEIISEGKNVPCILENVSTLIFFKNVTNFALFFLQVISFFFFV